MSTNPHGQAEVATLIECVEHGSVVDFDGEVCDCIDTKGVRKVNTRRYVAVDAVLLLLRGSDSDDHELEVWRRAIADEIEREFAA